MENTTNEATKRAVISLSGGLDSTCLLLKLLADGYEVRAYSFDYGQKHEVELKKVKKNIKFLQSAGLPLTHQIINLRDVFSDSMSSLHKGGDDIPHGMYDQDNMKSTVVENRNIIFSSIIYGKALAWANQTNSNVVITQGLHAGDHCFTGDTLIFTPKGLKRVDELQVGEGIYSFDGDTLKTEITKLQDIIYKGTNDTIYKIQTTQGCVKLTSEHKVYICDPSKYDPKLKDDPSWKLTLCSKILHLNKTFSHKLAKDLKVGDMLITPGVGGKDLVRLGDSVLAEITDIEIIHYEEPVNVFDLSVEKNHNFFAGDKGSILISNSIYPDCRPESQEMARELYKISNWGSERVDFIAPFINIHKGKVLSEGLDAMNELGFSTREINNILRNTHTCYDPNDKGESCGLCGSCTERIEAFAFNLMKDPAKYSLTKDELDKKYEEAFARLKPQN